MLKKSSLFVKIFEFLFLCFALALSLGSLAWLMARNEIILSNIWINSDTGELITYIGILATSLFSVLVYSVSRKTQNTNERLFEIELIRFRKDMLPLKIKQKELSTLITK